MAESYPQTLLGLAATPANPIPEGITPAQRINRLCGDSASFYCAIEDGTIRGVHWHAEGCLIVRASAAWLAQNLAGKSVQAALDWISDFRNSFLPNGQRSEHPLAAVYALPARYKCALLPFEACEDFLRQLL
ncbi:MAG: iron-sulfur cluster assembly scaffold protein [Turneriella sp.]|nr:iron-sulfur cluster assembly scaffold protein [Leptospiraceae bacterium]MCX7631756.1 iron-sulfur cluster assembly scaffold protein [Turneriella sp.]